MEGSGSERWLVGPESNSSSNPEHPKLIIRFQNKLGSADPTKRLEAASQPSSPAPRLSSKGRWPSTSPKPASSGSLLGWASCCRPPRWLDQPSMNADAATDFVQLLACSSWESRSARCGTYTNSRHGCARTSGAVFCSPPHLCAFPAPSDHRRHPLPRSERARAYRWPHRHRRAHRRRRRSHRGRAGAFPSRKGAHWLSRTSAIVEKSFGRPPEFRRYLRGLPGTLEPK